VIIHNERMTKSQIATYIDHTLLDPKAGVHDIIRICEEAKKYGFASVCVNPCYVPLCSSELANSSVKVCTVIGFPLGANSTSTKAFEAAEAVAFGADEVDMVINIGAALDGRFSELELDIASVVQNAKQAGKKIGKNIIVKVILETCFLDDSCIQTCCLCAVKAGADFVKTSTGFASPKGINGNLLPNGASVYHVELMRKTVGPDFGVKASGGIRSARAVVSMICAGANRIGTSSGVQIVETWDESVKISK